MIAVERVFEASARNSANSYYERVVIIFQFLLKQQGR